MSRKPIIILFVVLLLLFGFAGMATAEEGTADADSGSSSQENDSGGTSTGSADFGSAADPGTFVEGSLSDSSWQNSFTTSASDSSEPQEYTLTDSASPTATYLSEPEPDTSGSEPLIQEDPPDNSTATSEVTAQLEGNSSAEEISLAVENDENSYESGDYALPQTEPALGSDLSVVEDNTAGGEDPSLQDTSEVPAGTNGDDEETFPLLIDPYFYDANGNKNPYFGPAGIQQAINDFEANNGTGYIYVESGNFNAFTVNAVPNLAGVVFKDYFPLEADADFNPYATANWPVITGTVNIFNMSSDFTILGFVINGSLIINGCSGNLNLNHLNVNESTGGGINITNHTGNVTISNVEANKRTTGGFGANVVNSSGGNVTVTNSSFNNNALSGISIVTNGTITVNGISASNNSSGNGMKADGFSRLTINNAVFSGNQNGCGLEAASAKNANIILSNIYAGENSRHGLYLKTKGTITLNDIVAQDNGWDGVRIGDFSTPVDRNVVINRSSFNDNIWNGLYIYSAGAITLTDVSASRNNKNGAILNNMEGSGNITIRSSTAGLNTSYSGNGEVGILIDANGVIAISDVSLAGNNFQGANIRNHFASTARNMTISRVTAEGNRWGGIYISSKGSVLLTDVSSFNNQPTSGNYHGLSINNTYGTGTVTVRSSQAGTTYDFSGNNRGSGIYILSNGAVTVSDVSSNNNLWHGIRIENHTASAARNVTITRASVNGNTAIPHSRDGIYILSKGNVLLTDVSSSDNRNTSGEYHGLYINNRGVGSVWVGTGTVTIRSSRAGITYDFSGNNRGSGIYILSNGAVAVSDVSSNNNLWHGIRIENHTASAARNVTITRASVNGNTAVPYSRDGIYILSKGNVLLTDVSSSDNRNISSEYHGLYINNRSVGSVWVGTGSVTIRSSRAGITYDFSGNNRGSGIYILSNGAVTVSDVSANNNYNYGITIENHTASSARAVTITRGNFNDNNRWSGISIMSKGNVTLIDASASNNGKATFISHGVTIYNAHGNGNVIIRSSRAGNTYAFNENRDDGIYITSKGTVTISDVTASGNGNYYGIYVDNSSASAARAVSITRAVVNDNKGIYGAFIKSKGNVTLTDFSASNNRRDFISVTGVYIDNTYGIGSVTIRSSRAGLSYDFLHNSGHGIHIDTRGAVAISDVRILNNYLNGIYIWDGDDLSTSNVNLTRGIFNHNGSNGALIIVNGSVTLIDVSACGNGTGLDAVNRDGIKIYNSIGINNVTIRSSRAGTVHNYSSNEANGIKIDTRGAVSVSDVDASDNILSGIEITQNSYPVNRTVSLTRSSFDSNQRQGAYISAIGNVILTDVGASVNGLSGPYHGVYITNKGWEIGGPGTGNWSGLGNVTILSSRASSMYSFSDNTGNGIHILSNGVVSISNVEAVQNEQRGVLVENHTAAAERAVNLTRGSFSHNIREGVYIASKGTVTLTDVSASNNGSLPQNLNGVIIDNTYGNGNVTIRSSRAGSYFNFSGNSGFGIFIESKGTVTVINVNASENTFSGIRVFNHSAENARNVSITRGIFNNNNAYGVDINSKGAVFLTDIEADRNNSIGISIINNTGTGNVTVKSSRSNVYKSISGNGGHGLYIFSNGSVSVSNVNLLNNSNSGLSISTYTANKNISLQNINAQNNNGYGIYANLLDGTITASNVRSFYNGLDGIYIFLGSGKVNFDKSAFIGNSGNGICVARSPELVFLKNTYYYGNGAQNIRFN